MTRSVLSWCLYDLANTIFAMNMTSYHFPVWVVADRGGTELSYSVSFGFSMVASAFLMPWLGRRSDRLGGRRRWLILWTLSSVVLTGAIGFVPSLMGALVLFAGANFCYQLAGVFYNALLPDVAAGGQAVGRISGYGVALGYVGTLIGIIATAPFLAHGGRQATFLPTALLFGCLSVPAFLWVREAKRTGEVKKEADSVSRALRPLLAPACWGLSVVGVAVLFMAVYAKQAVGLRDDQLQKLLIGATGVTIVSTFLWGRLTERWGGFRALDAVWAVWAAVFGLACLGFQPWLFAVVATLAGTALGGTWVTSRVLLLEWVGADRLGEAFGLFGLLSRLCAVAGPVIWAGLLQGMIPLGRERYRAGMVILWLCTLIGWRLYHRIKR
jgi:MFS transporter, UMF1 family